MEELRLVQFDNIQQLPSKKKLDFLKKVDVHYCLQDEPHQSVRNEYMIGNTYLHVAARNSYTECVNELLNQGVDVVKQKLAEKETPLFLAIPAYLKYISIWKMTGILKKEVADILLSAQIKTEISTNPKDKDEISHFHIACIVNHTEAIKFFLNTGVSIDHAFSNDAYYVPGYTGLHCAIRYSSVEAAKMLIDHNVDIHLKDKNGISSLHLLIQRLMNLTDYVNIGKRACCLICEEEIERMQLIISHILKIKKAEEANFVDDTGLTAFHMACALSDKSVVESLLQQDVDINAAISGSSNFWPGYTPLHFAACFNVEIVKLLLQKGSIIAKNVEEKTALDLCMERYSPEVMHSILSCKPEWKNILFSDGSTNLLDVLLLMNDCDKFNNFLQSSADVNMILPRDSPLWPGNTLLHLAILMNEKTKNLKDFYDKSLFEENQKSSLKSYNCTESEELAYWKRIVICLVRGCSILSKNADGLTPIHLAFKLLKANIVDKLLNTCKNDAADPRNLTHFHIACIAGKSTCIERLLTQGVDVNSTVKSSFEWYSKTKRFNRMFDLILMQANSTPLHLAVINGNSKVVELLLQNNANIYAQDALGLTPIHLSLKFDYEAKPTISQTLFNNTSNLQEVVSKQGLTHLHVAAHANDTEAVDKLLATGSDVDAVFDYEKQENHHDELSYFADQTPLYIALRKGSDDAARALVRGGADISKRINSGDMDTPFILALSSMDRDSMKCLINKAKREYKDMIEPIDESGVTMLHVACGCFDLMWVKKLLERGADVNARIRDDNEYDNDTWRGETPLSVLINQALSAKKPPKNLASLIKLLVKYGADVGIQNTIRTPLHEVHEHLEAENGNMSFFSSIADLLLKSHKSYNVNPMDCDGLSHFHIACIRNNIEVVKKFLDNGIDVNHHQSYYDYSLKSGYTSLHYAFECRHVDLARLLIERGADVKIEAVNGNTPLHIALMENCADLDILEMLYRNGADFNARNLEDVTPLECLLKSKSVALKQLDFLLKRHSKFDATLMQLSEGIIGLAMRNAEPRDRKLIFQKLMKTEDVKSAISNGFNAIHSIVSVNQKGCLSLEFYVYAIKRLMEMGCNPDQPDEKGRSPIHDAVYFYNLEAVKALLQLGADLNVVDKQNKTPLSTSVISDKNIKQERKSELVQVILSHAWKMKFLKLELSSSIEESMLTLAGNKEPVNNVVLSQCENELKNLEKAKISDFLTARSFLCDGVSIYPLMISSERELVDAYFENSDNITQLFPEFGDLLNMQYRKALMNKEQLEEEY